MRAMRRQITVAFAVALIAACASDNAEPESAASPQGTSADSAATKTPVAPPPSVATGAADTMTPTLLPSRNKHDSTTFKSTVAFGRRQAAKWPASPTPLPGAILPSKRIVAFYGNPLSKRMGVLGEYA